MIGSRPLEIRIGVGFRVPQTFIGSLVDKLKAGNLVAHDYPTVSCKVALCYRGAAPIERVRNPGFIDNDSTDKGMVFHPRQEHCPVPREIVEIDSSINICYR